MAVRLNNDENYESILITLTKEKYPIAFENKVQELLEQGFDTREAAEKFVSETPIECEIYYEKHSGLFAVESDAVESHCDIYSPYSGELCEDFLEDEEED